MLNWQNIFLNIWHSISIHTFIIKLFTDLKIPKIFYTGLPENCQKVLELGKKSGEHLIWPVDEVEPFLVYCDMDTIPGTGEWNKEYWKEKKS